MIKSNIRISGRNKLASHPPRCFRQIKSTGDRRNGRMWVGEPRVQDKGRDPTCRQGRRHPELGVRKRDLGLPRIIAGQSGDQPLVTRSWSCHAGRSREARPLTVSEEGSELEFSEVDKGGVDACPQPQAEVAFGSKEAGSPGGSAQDFPNLVTNPNLL